MTRNYTVVKLPYCLQVFGPFLEHCLSDQDGRVVKALDLSSNGGIPAWVRTPLLVSLFYFFFFQIFLENEKEAQSAISSTKRRNNFCHSQTFSSKKTIIYRMATDRFAAIKIAMRQGQIDRARGLIDSFIVENSDEIQVEVALLQRAPSHEKIPFPGF